MSDFVERLAREIFLERPNGVQQSAARRAAQFVLREMAARDEVGLCARCVRQAIRDFAASNGIEIEGE